MLPWSSNLKDKAAEVIAELGEDSAAHMALAEAGTEAIARLQQGLARYQHYDYTRPAPTQPVLWQEGSSQLLDYRTGDAEPTLLFVPSLINRAYIFDLNAGNSLIGYLQEQGFGCLLMDWGDPGEAEKGFGIEDYITRLQNAISTLDTKVVLVGYCMGGMMSLAVAQKNPDAIAGLALLATPWDFHSQDVALPPNRTLYARLLEEFLDNHDTVPADMVYQLLYMSNPWPVHSKYQRFADLPANHPDAEYFVVREHWVQDGVPLTHNVARSCFIDWPVHNTAARGKWVVNGQAVMPESINTPTLLAIARHDTIAPPQCAGALAVRMNNALTLYAPSGHIGLIAGRSAQEYLWTPLAKWLRNL